MLTEDQAREFANHWIQAWNSHELDTILSHYAPEVVLTSPVAARLLQDPSGTIAGKEGLRAYFERGLIAYPQLAFKLLEVLCGLSSVVLYYVNQEGTRTGEYMELDANQKIVRVVANYSSTIRPL
jgi:predicted ester cyclase